MADLKLPRLNKFIVSGRIGNDIELKYTPKGTPVVRFVIASDRSYKDESDQWQTVTSWIDCVAWS
ncbi:MAG: single-stranded DNA-binding protein, partial [Candidatus Cloacimonetes bacterium]|nr:single-stranded DNA-binding protein [Candidatus Cloacimonadota bacterium]